MEEFTKLYDFISLAEKNRKYATNTAHGKRAALKLFETVLHPDERQSLELITERMEEIYLSLISRHKDSFSIQSLNTYKGRFLKILEDYQKYGKNPDTIVRWEVKQRPYTKQTIKEDTKKDISLPPLSLPTHTGVHKFELSLDNGQTCTLEVPTKLTAHDAATIQKIIQALAE